MAKSKSSDPKSSRLLPDAKRLFIVSASAVLGLIFICFIIFVIDFSADTPSVLKDVALASLSLLFLLSILTAFYIMAKRNAMFTEERNKLANVMEKLKASETLFRTIFEESPVGITIGNKQQPMLKVNAMYEKIVGRPKEEIMSLGWQAYTHPDDIAEDLGNFKKFEAGETDSFTMAKRYIRPDGSIVWVNMAIVNLPMGEKSQNYHVCMVQDITERIHAEAELRESERSKSILLSNLQGMAYRCLYDKNRTMIYVSDGCYMLTGYKPESLLCNQDLSFSDILLHDYRKTVWQVCSRAIKSKILFKYEYPIQTAWGEVRWVYDQGQGIYDENGEVVAIEGLVVDISERRNRENEIQYLNIHDSLTGMYNRRFLEQEKQRLNKDEYLPLTVMIGDINGVRLINDAFGHAVGDSHIIRTAKIMQSFCREADIIARTGGDEFTILMPNTDSDTAYTIMNQIRTECEKLRRTASGETFIANISLGYSTKESMGMDINQVIKTAENYMHKRKLLELKSSHSAIISSIRATMLEKSLETEAHEERLEKLARLVGVKLGLSQSSIDELVLLAMLHDIGKVAIDDRILNKRSRLTDEEWAVMKKHPAIGYRIAISSPELVPIAEYILCHHERWDGNGYPQGLRGKDIPLLSRIIAVLDAYDAMTQDRPYRKALPSSTALEEIRKKAGSQFDPEVVSVFLEIVHEQPYTKTPLFEIVSDKNA